MVVYLTRARQPCDKGVEVSARLCSLLRYLYKQVVVLDQWCLWHVVHQKPTSTTAPRFQESSQLLCTAVLSCIITRRGSRLQ
jgi:hypothetical protein